MAEIACVRDIWLVSESDGIKVKVLLDGLDEWITVISENRCYNIDGSPSLISHTVSRHGIDSKKNMTQQH